MFTNRLGVCFATVGPGAFNLVTGLAVAMSDSYPVLALTGYIETRWQGHGAVNDTSGLNGTPDSQAMFAATTKRSYLLTDVADTCDVLEEAVNLAFEGRPGPVHVARPPEPHPPPRRTWRTTATCALTGPPQPDPAVVEEIAAALADALGGRSARCCCSPVSARSAAGAQGEVKRFAERFQVPVVTTLDGKGVIAEDHPLCVGVFSESGHSSAWKAFREADVVLAVGNSLNQHATFGLREDLFEGKTLIQVNISGRRRSASTTRSTTRSSRTPGPALAAITEALAPGWGRRAGEGRRRRTTRRGKIPHVHRQHPPRAAGPDDGPDAAAGRGHPGRRRCAPRLARLLRGARRRAELPQVRRLRPDGRPHERRHRPEGRPAAPDRRGRLRRRLLRDGRLRADDRGARTTCR